MTYKSQCCLGDVIEWFYRDIWHRCLKCGKKCEVVGITISSPNIPVEQVQ